MLLLLIAIVSAIVAGVLLVRGTLFMIKYSEEWIKNGRPTVFPRPKRCPRCDRRIRRSERMRSFTEVFLGGWSCPGCGSEFDQLDNVRVARAWNASLRDLKKREREVRLLNRATDDRTPVERLFDD